MNLPNPKDFQATIKVSRNPDETTQMQEGIAITYASEWALEKRAAIEADYNTVTLHIGLTGSDVATLALSDDKTRQRIVDMMLNHLGAQVAELIGKVVVEHGVTQKPVAPATPTVAAMREAERLLLEEEEKR